MPTTVKQSSVNKFLGVVLGLVLALLAVQFAALGLFGGKTQAAVLNAIYIPSSTSPVVSITSTGITNTASAVTGDAPATDTNVINAQTTQAGRLLVTSTDTAAASIDGGANVGGNLKVNAGTKATVTFDAIASLSDAPSATTAGIGASLYCSACGGKAGLITSNGAGVWNINGN